MEAGKAMLEQFYCENFLHKRGAAGDGVNHVNRVSTPGKKNEG